MIPKKRQDFCLLASHPKNLQIIRACLNRGNITQSPHSIEERPGANSVFSEFKAVTGDQLMKLIGKISRTSCDLDSIRCSLLTTCLQRSLLPLVTRIISLPLDSAVIPSTFLKKTPSSHLCLKKFT